MWTLKGPLFTITIFIIQHWKVLLYHQKKANVCFASRNLLFVVSFSMWRASQKYLSDKAPNRVWKDQTLKSAMFTNEKKISSNFCRKQFRCIDIQQFLSIKSEETEVLNIIR